MMTLNKKHLVKKIFSINCLTIIGGTGSIAYLIYWFVQRAKFNSSWTNNEATFFIPIYFLFLVFIPTFIVFLIYTSKNSNFQQDNKTMHGYKRLGQAVMVNTKNVLLKIIQEFSKFIAKPFWAVGVPTYAIIHDLDAHFFDWFYQTKFFIIFGIICCVLLISLMRFTFRTSGSIHELLKFLIGLCLAMWITSEAYEAKDRIFIILMIAFAISLGVWGYILWLMANKKTKKSQS